MSTGERGEEVEEGRPDGGTSPGTGGAENSAGGANAVGIDDEPLFDYVVVGAGPSCMGLLLGVLEPFLRVDVEEDEGGGDGTTTTTSSSGNNATATIPPFTVAVLERGGTYRCRSTENESGDQDEGEKEASSPPPSDLVQDPSRWFAASHATGKGKGGGDGSTTQRRSSAASAEAASPDAPATSSMGTTSSGRILDFVVGKGLGGGTNVHASLCVPPSSSDFDGWGRNFEGNGKAKGGTGGVMGSVEHVLRRIEANRCLHTQQDRQEGDRNGDGGDPQAPSKPPLWTESVFPSSVTSVPCTVSPDPPHRRRNFHDALLRPLFRDHPHLRNAVAVLRGHEAERLLYDDDDDDDDGDLGDGDDVPSVVGVECRVAFVAAAMAGGRQPRRQQQYRYRKVRARKRVILCAGALETPALMLASGIGRSEDLLPEFKAKASGAEVVPGGYEGAVGRNLRDHVMLGSAVFSTNSEDSPMLSLTGVRELHQLELGRRRFQVGIMDAAIYADVLPHVIAGMARWNFFGGGRGESDNENDDKSSSTARRSVAVLRPLLELLQAGLSSVVFPALKFVFHVLIAYPPFAPLLRRYVVGVAVNLLSPTSTGHVRIKRRKRGRTELRRPRRSDDGAGQADPPLRRSDVELVIDAAYLRDDEDLECIQQAWNACQVVAPRGIEFFPGPLVRRDFGLFGSNELDPTRFRMYAHATCLPYYHYCGTCALRTPANENDGWVVDEMLRVRGVKGLSVCDASVFPNPLSAPIALTCAAVGHVLGSILAEEEAKKYRRENRE